MTTRPAHREPDENDEAEPTTLAEAVRAIPPPPCEDCPLTAACAAERLACVAYSAYVRDMPVPTNARNPTRRIYRQIYPNG